MNVIEEKRKLVNFVFATLELKGVTLCYSLKKPFDHMVALTTCQEWLAVIDTLRTDSEMRVQLLNMKSISGSLSSTVKLETLNLAPR
jgi:5-methylthioribose kinase